MVCGDSIGGRGGWGCGRRVVRTVVVPTQAELGWGTRILRWNWRVGCGLLWFPPCRQKEGDKMGHGAFVWLNSGSFPFAPLRVRMTNFRKSKEPSLVAGLW